MYELDMKNIKLSRMEADLRNRLNKTTSEYNETLKHSIDITKHVDDLYTMLEVNDG